MCEHTLRVYLTLIVPSVLVNPLLKTYWNFDQPGFTALGHPSPFSEGEKHGVYVLDKPPSALQLESFVFTPECTKVLQKPSIQKMYENGAVIKDEKGLEFVYTDSCFFFDSEVAKDLVAFYTHHSPLKCEIDAYGDFLTALGRRATDDHTEIVDNVVKVCPDLIMMKKRVFRMLYNREINLIILNKSRFYHVGTLREMIQNYCIEKDVRENFGLGRIVSSKVVGDGEIKQIRGVVMMSIIHNKSIIPFNSVVSYSRFNAPVIAGKHTIISNCSIGVDSKNGIKRPEILPDNLMFHTIPVVIQCTRLFVTVAFGIDDNLKKSVQLDDVDNLQYFGISMKKVLESLGLAKENIFHLQECSLWNAKLFATKPTMEESFSNTLRQVMAIKNHKPFTPLYMHSMYSMADILHYKDTKSLINYRSKLKQEIIDQ
ncbi:Fucose-1-phosphate guanylyltransferase [Nymphon striatum]|nr:Fucose-1-phosphate guanylyltransferase [Nymphon striatum]